MKELSCNIISLDREITLAINGWNSPYWDGVMSTLTSKYVWIPLALIIIYVIFKNNNWRRACLILLMIVLCVTIADQLSSSIIKPLFHRPRPTHDPLLMDQIDVVNNYRGGHYGFISSHAANCFAVAVFLMNLFRHRLMTGVLLLWAVFICYTRIYMGVHFFGDILFGSLTGALIGGVLFWVYNKYLTSLEWINVGGKTAAGYHCLWLVYAGLSVTYLFIFIQAFL